MMEDTVPKVLGTVFRVTGISPTTSLDELSAILLSEFSIESEITLDTSNSSLCQSCYDDRTQTALIQFTPRPPLHLKNLSNKDTYRIDIGTGRDIVIDKYFYGLTQLYTTTGTIKADVVAVCGLNGHAYGSWAGKADHRGLKKMWLRHFLSEDLPHCRTMIYGYNTDLADHSIHTIPDYTDSFLEELRKARGLESQQTRPIIFIGHSFGGIVIAQSLVKAKENETRHGHLFSSTKATIFFGTPHRGLVVDDILAMVGSDSPRDSLVKSLQCGSVELKIELNRFINISTIIKMKIVSFKEIQQTRKLVRSSDGRWFRGGDYFTAVESDSSMLQLPDSIEETLAAEGDHSTMVKFTHMGHSSYTSVIRYLKSFTLDDAVVRCVTVHHAILRGKTRDLEWILQNNPVDLRKQITYMGRETTYLHFSIHNGGSTTRLLLSYGADIEAVDEDGLTALHTAVLEDKVEILEFLLMSGAEIAAKDNKGRSALHCAASGRNEKVVEVLLRNGADITAKDNLGQTALHLAAECGNEEIVEVLLMNEVDITAKDTFGGTPLHFAVKGGGKSVAELLLVNGADIMAKGHQGETPLHCAAHRGYKKIVNILLDSGAVTTARTSNGSTPLHYAASRGYDGTMKILLSKGADITAKDTSGDTPLHSASNNGAKGVVELLLLSGADITAKNDAGFTALHIAASRGYEKIVEVLLFNGADITTENTSGDTPLHCAAGNGNERILSLLLVNGADITAQNGIESTALHTAASCGNEKVVEVLISSGADITATDEDGDTALHLAASNGNEKVVELLLVYGADTKVRNEIFLRPVHQARLSRHSNIVKILKKAREE